MYLHTRSAGQLFDLDRLRAKTKVRVTLIRDMLFADDGAVTSLTEQQLQCLMDRFSQACKDFGLTISLKRPTCWAKTWTSHLLLPSTAMNWMLSILPWFHHQRQPERQPALDAEINQRTRKATTMLGPLTTRFWEKPKLTVATNIAVNEACIISTLLHGSEAWTIYAKQERKLNSLHMRSLHLILGIIWSERVA